jgi:hypothetical protein
MQTISYINFWKRCCWTKSDKKNRTELIKKNIASARVNNMDGPRDIDMAEAIWAECTVVKIHPHKTIARYGKD